VLLGGQLVKVLKHDNQVLPVLHVDHVRIVDHDHLNDVINQLRTGSKGGKQQMVMPGIINPDLIHDHSNRTVYVSL
jgi:hypothetical protein